ncbi:uncharacterized protein zgc:174945 [Neoarius graeffei]|uniref:uncharacterized protein zgc:174945 n=1 Tax=Neoarius graeffei TaxID=443677 RepID=UPI00298C0E4D|nr:uncharacterized protein zgc:174945 [Neoarius graeffei]
MSLNGSTALLFITLCTFPSTPKSIDTIFVQVKYSRQPIKRTEGQTLTLNCTAQYEKQHCENISVFWCLSVEDKPCEPLTDLDKYLIQISETKLSKETLLRQQDAFVTFTQLTRKDTGFYQCKAKCQHTGATAMGHRINVTVTGQEETRNIFTSDAKGQTFLNRSNQCSMDMFLLTILFSFILLWIHKM